MRVINGVGKIVPSDFRKNYFYGLLKDVSFQKVLDAFALGSRGHEAPLLQDSKFVGVVKVAYSEADEGIYLFIYLFVLVLRTIYQKDCW